MNVNEDESDVQARMTATNSIVDYLRGEGTQIARDTLGHATAIAATLSAEGLLIDRKFQVAISPTRLNALKHAEVTLAALESAGVDNWEHYDDAIAALHSDDVVE